jgi:hypothetical protein
MWQIEDICHDLNLQDEIPGSEDEDGSRTIFDPIPEAVKIIRKYLENYGIEVND